MGLVPSTPHQHTGGQAMAPGPPGRIQGTDGGGVEWWNGGIVDGNLAVSHFSEVTDLTLDVITTSGTVPAPLNGGGLDLAAPVAGIG